MRYVKLFVLQLSFVERSTELKNREERDDC